MVTFGEPPVIHQIQQGFPLPKIRAIRYFIQTGGSALIRCFVENLYLLHHIPHSPSQLHQVDIILLRDIYLLGVP